MIGIENNTLNFLYLYFSNLIFFSIFKPLTIDISLNYFIIRNLNFILFLNLVYNY